MLTSLQQALAGQDSEQFRQAAHSIKSTSNSFGALKLGALAKELEMMGRERNLEGAPAKVEQLVQDYSTVQMRLKELCNG